MQKVKLGRTDLLVSRTSIGCIPIQRISFEEAKKILRKAYDNGINFFDTARVYTDSEEKIGYSLSDVRKHVIIATKVRARNKRMVFELLETSLKMLKTDYVDLLQLHNMTEISDPKDSDSAYWGLVEAKKKGLARFIGTTNHRLHIINDAVASGLYDTVQFPLSAISSAEDLQLIEDCKRKNIGLIAMKALCGGLLTNAVAAFAFLRQFENVVPIWGIQKECELDEFLHLENNPPVLDHELTAVIEKDRKELGSTFCRGCGYCLPCTADIPIPMAARMSYLLRRTLSKTFLTAEWKAKMERIDKCTECGNCSKRCPYHLNPPVLLKYMVDDYRNFYSEWLEHGQE